ELGELDDPGVRIKDVDRPSVLHDPGVKSVKVSRISDDTLDGSRFVPKRLECGIQLRFVSTGNKYASPLIDELPRRHLTHAAASLGDDGDFPFQSLHFRSPFAARLPCHRSPSRTVVRSGPYGAQPSSFRACTARTRALVARATRAYQSSHRPWSSGSKGKRRSCCSQPLLRPGPCRRRRTARSR